MGQICHLAPLPLATASSLKTPPIPSLTASIPETPSSSMARALPSPNSTSPPISPLVSSLKSSDPCAGSPINLERALSLCLSWRATLFRVTWREIVSVRPERDSLWVKVRIESKEVLRYIVSKGFITVDGASLTVVGVYEEEGCFYFILLAYSQMEIVLLIKNVGDKVNLEVDMLGKYVEKLLKSGAVRLTT